VDGEIHRRYPLRETDSAAVEVRTEWNGRDSDGTLILTLGQPSDGTPLTETCAKRYGRPLLDRRSGTAHCTGEIAAWLSRHDIQVL